MWGLSHFRCVWLFATPWTVTLSMDFPGKDTGKRCHALLFPTEGSNVCLLRLLYCRQILYCWATGEAQSCPTITKGIRFIYLFIFGCEACGILVPWPEIKPVPLALEAQSLNHWTTREIPLRIILLSWREGVKVTQSCPTLCNPMDYALHGILQARILEWVAFPFSRGSSQPRDQTQVSCTAGGFFTSWATREALWREGRC